MTANSIKSLKLSSVPTNIITGFLGVGKTSTILHLLEHKPSKERWAVLVNEFGEIGIDGTLIESQTSEQSGVTIREVPGGCMCCTAGLPMKVALAQLLRQAKPDRLIIEPTGLGHPSEVLQTLNGPNFESVLSVQKVVTLVDARQLSDSRYAEHETFQEQVTIADVVVANKQALYSDDDRAALDVYLSKHAQAEVPVLFADHGQLKLSVLEGLREKTVEKSIMGLPLSTSAVGFGALKTDSSDPQGYPFEQAIPECGFLAAANSGEGFVSLGWRFSPRFIFNRDQLFAFISGVDALRLKATFVTEDGCFAYNLSSDALSEVPFDYADESRIEIIASELNEHWQAALLACVAKQ